MPELDQLTRQRAHHVSQSAGLGEWRALRSGKRNLHRAGSQQKPRLSLLRGIESEIAERLSGSAGPAHQEIHFTISAIDNRIPVGRRIRSSIYETIERIAFIEPWFQA
jgi:hypothetical protein